MNPPLFELLETRALLAAIASDSSSDESMSESPVAADLQSFETPSDLTDSQNDDSGDSAGVYVGLGQFIALSAGWSALTAVSMVCSCSSLLSKKYSDAAGVMGGGLIAAGGTGLILYKLFPFWDNPISYAASIVAWSLSGASFMAGLAIGIPAQVMWIKFTHSSDTVSSKV